MLHPILSSDTDEKLAWGQLCPQQISQALAGIPYEAWGRRGRAGVTLALPCVVGFFPIPPAAQIDGRARIQPQAELQPGLLEHRRMRHRIPGIACKNEDFVR